MPRRHSPPWTRTRMARLIRKKCARSLIAVEAGSVPARVAKGVVLISVDPVKVVKADEVKVGLVLETVKTRADVGKAGPVLAIVKTHADPAKAIGINLVLNAVTLKAC